MSVQVYCQLTRPWIWIHPLLYEPEHHLFQSITIDTLYIIPTYGIWNINWNILKDHTTYMTYIHYWRRITRLVLLGCLPYEGYFLLPIRIHIISLLSNIFSMNISNLYLSISTLVNSNYEINEIYWSFWIIITIS